MTCTVFRSPAEKALRRGDVLLRLEGAPRPQPWAGSPGLLDQVAKLHAGQTATFLRIGDLDEARPGWLVRAAVAKTRRPRWVELPPDLFAALLVRLPAREDRDPEAPLFAGVTADRLRMAIGRACRDAAVPRFGPHSLRHRRISLLHRQGVSWTEISELVGQRSRVVTADRYTHALVDYREVDRAKLLGRVQVAPTPVLSSDLETLALAGTF